MTTTINTQHDKPGVYDVEDTPCRPRRFKIVPVGSWQPNNSWTEYYETVQAAIAEIERRGGEVRRIPSDAAASRP